MHTGQLGYKYRAYNLIQLFKSTYYSNTYQTNVLVSSPNSRGSVRTTRVPCTRHLPPPPSAHYNSLLYHNSKTASLCYDPCVYQTASPLIYDFFLHLFQNSHLYFLISIFCGVEHDGTVTIRVRFNHCRVAF